MKRRILLPLALCVALLLATACAAAPRSGSSSESSVYHSSAGAGEAAPAAAEPMAFPDMAAEEAGGYAESPAAAPNRSAQTAAAGDASVRKIIYNANMDVTADDPAAAMQTVIEKATALGGYISNSYTTNDDDGAAHCSVTIKVPAGKLEELVGTAKGTGRVNDYQLYSDDISLQYYDINARLENAKAEEKQLLAILEQCTSIEEILEVRKSLSGVRSDIESYQAQINLWDNLVGYATLNMSIRRTPKEVVSAADDLLAIWKAGDVWEDMTRGFRNSARFMVNALSAIGIFLAVAIIPAILLFLCIGLPMILRRRKKKRAALAAAAAARNEESAADAPDSAE